MLWAFPALVSLLGCPQTPVSSSTASASTTGTFGTFTTLGTASGTTNGGSGTTGAPTTGGTVGGSATTGSGGTTGATGTANCDPSGSTPPPSITCTEVDGGSWGVIAGEPVEIDCSGPSGIGWSVVPSISGATIQDELPTQGKVYVTHKAAALGPLFPDTTATVTITACANGGQPATEVIPINLVGDLLIADVANKQVESVASDGTDVGPFIPALNLNGTPTLLSRLPNAQILVGREQSTGNPTLQVYDYQGNHQFDLDETDHADNYLWQPGDFPWQSAIDGQGNIWVTRVPADDSTKGSLYQFSSTGSYLATIPAPKSFAAYQEPFAPQGIAALPDGSMVTSIGTINGPVLAVFPATGTSTTIDLTLQVCVQDASAQGYACQADSDNISYGTVESFLFENGILTLGTSNEVGDYVFAQLTSELTFAFSTDVPISDGNIVGIYNTAYFGLEQVGRDFIASSGTAPGGCLAAIDPTDLPDSAYPSGCWSTAGADGDGLPQILGIVRLR